MNILLVCNFQFPWNRGIDRAVLSFKENGHEVSVAASTVPPASSYENARLYGLADYCAGAGWLKKILSIRNGLNPTWLFFLLHVGRREKVDALVVREIHVVPMAWIASKFIGARLLLDMREAMPFAVQEYGKSSLLHYITRNHYLVFLYEKLSVLLSQHIFVVCQAQVNRLNEAHRISRTRLSVVPNTVNTDFAERGSRSFSSSLKKPAELRQQFVYFGYLSPFRNVDKLIQVFGEIAPDGFEFTVYCDGDPEALKATKQTASRYGNVHIKPFVAPESVAEEMSKFGFGVIPYEPSAHVNSTVPGKYYEYLAVGLPLVSTKIDEVESDVNAYGIGYVVADVTDSDEVSALLSEISAMSEQEYIGMRKAVQSCFAEQYKPEKAWAAYEHGLRKVS